MGLTTIFVVRHGFRPAFHVNPTSGDVYCSMPSPTGRPADPALTAYGVQQAIHMAKLADTLKPRISRIYTSPFYRCIQTIQPFASRLPQVPLISDQGLGDWFGKAHFLQPAPAPLYQLQAFFPSLIDKTSTIPDPRGEDISELHDRIAYALWRIIADADTVLTSQLPESIIISSHAAPIIAIGRVLTGQMPQDPAEKDFNTFTCSISKFTRKPKGSVAKLPDHTGNSGSQKLNWRQGRGVRGGWICEMNANVDHLPNGGERNWHFSGDESFMNAIESHNKAPSTQATTRQRSAKAPRL